MEHLTMKQVVGYEEPADSIPFFDLAAIAHGQALGKGWWDEMMLIRSLFEEERVICDEDFDKLEATIFCNKIARIHTEIFEASKEYAAGRWQKYFSDHEAGQKPEGLGAELADALIRLADFCGGYGITSFEEFENDKDPVKWLDDGLAWIGLRGKFGTSADMAIAYQAMPEIQLYTMHNFAADITEAISTRGDVRRAVINLLFSITCFAAHFPNEIQLDRDVREKLAFNKKRTYRHGGKLA